MSNKIILRSAVTGIIVTIIAGLSLYLNALSLYYISLTILPAFVIAITLSFYGDKPTFGQWMSFIVLCTAMYLLSHWTSYSLPFGSIINIVTSWLLASFTVLFLFHFFLRKLNRLSHAIWVGVISSLIASIPVICYILYFSNKFYLDNDPKLLKFILTHSAYPLWQTGVSAGIYNGSGSVL